MAKFQQEIKQEIYSKLYFYNKHSDLRIIYFVHFNVMSQTHIVIFYAKVQNHACYFSCLLNLSAELNFSNSNAIKDILPYLFSGQAQFPPGVQ